MYHILKSFSAGSKNTPSLNTIAEGLGAVAVVMAYGSRRSHSRLGASTGLAG